ncbi:MAG TPA: aminotransferase class V-fold PLP-dependent enzyme [Longimicrobiales bacterium]|nr:aminotransferase class V-fold PLP-dependent enzyme [Longimicrobiales bacterium]
MNRRHFLAHAGTAAAAALAWPRRLDALARDIGAAQDIWETVRAAFLIPADRIYLNVGTLGPQPHVVVDAVVEHTRRVAMTYPPGVQWDELKDSTAALLGGDPEGYVFPRNTTEAMNFVANGLELGAGDEVLTTTHEHIGGLCCWQLIAARRGIRLRQLALPVPATSADELLDVFRRALSPRTRVISVSHVTFTNGTVMPVREVAALCRERGIVCVVDGAHPPGMMRVDVRAIDADFYASSPHKWLCAPQGSGLLYMREEWRTRLWPTLASGDWDNTALGAHRFNHLGSFDESRLAGLLAALRLHETIGADRIEARVRQLDQLLLDRLAGLPRVRIMSPTAPALGIGLIAFMVDGIPSLELQRRLAEAANIRTRVVSEYGYNWMRLSPHIYNRVEELDRTVDVIADML